MGADADLVTRLRAGDEAAFAELVDRYHASLLRLARNFVPSDAVAEEVVQETWLAVVRGIDRFEGRSSVKTWLFAILGNRARTAGVRESRVKPQEFDEAAVDPGRFGRDGRWTAPPVPWDHAEQRLIQKETIELIYKNLDRLPPSQQQVLVMRDIEGLDSAEVCGILGITDGNQRVLLHRGRSKIRQVLEDELGKV